MKIVLVTGGFDPLHSGHIEYFKEAKKLGDKLIVAVNSDAWLTRKKGRPFMPFEERIKIIDALDVVDQTTYVMNDDRNDDAGGAIFHTFATHGNIEIIFANGGDRQQGNVPEEEQWGNDPRVKFVYGVGGEDKKNSSSWILKEWSQPTTERAWGRYTVLDKGDGWATKKLEFDAGKSLSDQRHFKRSEHWHVVEGDIQMTLEYANEYSETKIYMSGDSIDIPVRTWHKATNVGTTTAKVVEVWLGEELTEQDIERRD
jgi:cytidyltransferase-like protein